MAKTTKERSIEETLWESANKLRGSVEPAEYKHVVLGLIFLKFAADKFEEHRKALIADGKEKYIELADFYNMSNVFFLDETSRWSYIIKHSKQNDIALIIDTALHNIEKNNKALKGALPDNYFSRLGLDITKLSSLLDTINDIDTLKDKAQDIVGRVYEYFLSKFALAEGKGKGEFYTPKSIVNLIAEMIEPYKGIIYDPACGSGGMFVQSIKFIENHHGNKKEISIYGQEYTNTTYKLAKMNLAIRGISGNLGEKAADTFGDDQHKDLKADGVEEIFKLGNENETEQDLFDEDYLAKIDKIKLPNTKIKLLQQLLAKVIGEMKKVNRVKGVDFTKKMQALVQLYNERDKNDIFRSEVYDEIAEQLTELIIAVRKEFSAGDALGIDFEEKAFYDILKELCAKYDFKYPEPKLIELAKAVKDLVDGQAKFPDWNKRDDIKSSLKVGLILLLDAFGYPPVERDEVYVEIFEQAENFKKNQL